MEPFVRTLQTATRDRVEWSDFIWEPKNEEGWGEGGGSSEEEEDEEESGEEEEGMEREGEGKAQASNVDGFWGTDRVRNTLKRETGKRISASISTST